MLPPPPLPTKAEYEYVQLPAGSPVTVEPPVPGSVGLYDSEKDTVSASAPSPPLGIKLTGYRLLNMTVLLGFGLAKFILSLQGQSVAPAGLEWIAGSAFAALSYWIGLYEAVEPPKWEWLLHIDWAPAIVFAWNCFFRGAAVFQAFVLSLQYLALFSPLLYCAGVLALWSLSPRHGLLILLPWFAMATGPFNFVVLWKMASSVPIWNQKWFWPSTRMFFETYNSYYPTQYRLLGKAVYIIGLLSGFLLMCLLPRILIYAEIKRLDH